VSDERNNTKRKSKADRVDDIVDRNQNTHGDISCLSLAVGTAVSGVASTLTTSRVGLTFFNKNREENEDEKRKQLNTKPLKKQTSLVAIQRAFFTLGAVGIGLGSVLTVQGTI
jgi:hypothetical protein